MTLEELQVFAESLDSSAKIVIKDDSPLMKFLFFFVRLFNKRFMEDYATTICNRVYIPRAWIGRDLQRLLVHEVGGHVRQCRACGLGIHPWVGILPYAILYGLTFFPIGLAYFRYLFERKADAKAWAWSLRNGEPVDVVKYRMQSFAETVASWDYFKPWPTSWVVNGFYQEFHKVVAEFKAWQE